MASTGTRIFQRGRVELAGHARAGRRRAGASFRVRVAGASTLPARTGCSPATIAGATGRASGEGYFLRAPVAALVVIPAAGNCSRGDRGRNLGQPDTAQPGNRVMPDSRRARGDAGVRRQVMGGGLGPCLRERRPRDTWKPQGAGHPGGTSVQAIASRTVADHRAEHAPGLLRSTDNGQTWEQIEGKLPVHLEAGPLVRDPHDTHVVRRLFALPLWRDVAPCPGGSNACAPGSVQPGRRGRVSGAAYRAWEYGRALAVGPCLTVAAR